MKLQQLLSYTRKAVDEYQMIETGDKIAVGISGGKDSLTLLYALHGLKRFYPRPFTIEAITVDLGHPGFHLDRIADLCRTLEVPYTVVHTDIARIIFDERKETNPCSLCAKMRKGALNEAIKKAGCNKVAYAHHKDLTVIRPLMFVDEMDVRGFQKLYQLPVEKSACPADGHTKREYVKNLIRQLTAENPGVRERMFAAVINGNIPGWPARTSGK